MVIPFFCDLPQYHLSFRKFLSSYFLYRFPFFECLLKFYTKQWRAAVGVIHFMERRGADG